MCRERLGVAAARQHHPGRNACHRSAFRHIPGDNRIGADPGAFVHRHRAQHLSTGLTDLDYSEVLAGLNEDDQVLLLPSSDLILSQQRFQGMMKRFTGIPGMQGGDKNGAEKNGGKNGAEKNRGKNGE